MSTTRPPRAWVRESNRSKKENRRSENKLWEVVYEDPKTRRRRTRGGFGASKAAAKEWADEFMSKTRRGEWIDPERSRITFGELARQWQSSQHFDRERTKFNHHKMFGGDNPLMRTFRDVPIGEITPTRVSTFIKDTRAIRAAQTVRHQFYALRMVLDYAVDNDMLLVNPARRVDLRRVPKPQSMAHHERKRDRLTTADVARLVAILPEPYDMYVYLLANTGMRPEEACGLMIGDVLPGEQALSIHQVVTEVGGRLVREDATKTPKSTRTIDLDPETWEALARYLTEHRKRAAKWFTEHSEHEHPGDNLPLFVGTRLGRDHGVPVIDRLDYSKPMRHSGFYKKHWRKATRAAGLPDTVRVYDLRHFHASALLDSGMSIKDVQERMGHANATMTMDRYWHSRTDDEARRLRREAVANAMGRGARENVTSINTKRSV